MSEYLQRKIKKLNNELSKASETAGELNSMMHIHPAWRESQDLRNLISAVYGMSVSMEARIYEENKRNNPITG